MSFVTIAMQNTDIGAAQTPLPTRVSRACDRCRRNKSRCDNFRPCSLCQRASAKCVTDGPGADKSRSRREAAPLHAPRSTPTVDEPITSPQYKRARRETQEAYSSAGPALEQTASRRQRLDSGSQIGSPHSPFQDRDSVYENDGESAITIARNIHRIESQHIDEHAIDSIPGAAVGHQPRERGSLSQACRAATASYLLHQLPDENVMITLLDEYFHSVHWFSLVILESKFRPSFDVVRTGFAKSSERPFLLLLSAMLGLAAWYRGHTSQPTDNNSPAFWQDWSTKLLANVESQIMDVMNQNSITSIQTLILLGSFYVYHGRPNLSFSLLGATVKAAQAASLHREPAHGSHADAEERKRVWWTIYTWDRFASITYGRPLGINDKDCNISQPDDVFEDTCFREPADLDRYEGVCFSVYQRELNKLYQIASPAIKNVYSAPQFAHSKTALDDLSLVKDVTLRLWRWRRSLPEHLVLQLNNDCSQTLDAGARAHCLQSLSLQLTFDSLIIVLHRPFIRHGFETVATDASRQTQNSVGSQTHVASSENEHSSPSVMSEARPELDTSSHQQWWEAAVRTSRVTKLPQLAQIASDSHLVAFLAINLFSAAMVMVVVALSDPLTNSAQEAKRAVARIYRLQESVGSRSTLSEQSSQVLRSLVALLLRRESDAILTPVAQVETATSRDDQSQINQSNPIRPSVRDALSMPLGPQFDQVDNATVSQADKSLSLTSRLNDSLATVQRAFTFSPNQDLTVKIPMSSSGTISEGHLYPDPSNTAASERNIMNQSGFRPDVGDWNNGNTIGDGGLYWFWDPTWDDLYSNINL